ncbi:MAG: EF-hand domain-containing protein [Phenylobacterium sp.]|nr:MAG: EF-hand domain-containing protein [Phenylobacterium sp.]
MRAPGTADTSGDPRRHLTMRTLILAAAAALAVTGVAGVAAAQMPSPADIVKAWDKDGDGTISKDEWVAAGRPAERFDLVDTNHDGKITVEELAAAMARMRPGGGGQPAQPAPPTSPPPAPPATPASPH